MGRFSFAARRSKSTPARATSRSKPTRRARTPTAQSQSDETLGGVSTVLDQLTRQLIQTKLLDWGPAAAPLFAGEDIGQDVEFAIGDLALVSGTDTLAQDLTLALTTA